jgi:hypothetical protein
MTMSTDLEILSVRRVRIGLWIAASFVAVLVAIAANDALVQSGRAHTPARGAVLGCLFAAGIALLANLTRFALLLRRSMNDAEARRELWDERATTNTRQSMVFAYLALLAVIVTLAVISMFTTLSAPWVVNGMLVTAFLSQAISFSLLERRGAN